MADEPVPGLVGAIDARPALRQQLGTAAYAQLLALACDPLAARINSIWAETLFPPVLNLLALECPEYRDEIQAMRAVVVDAQYRGPVGTTRYVTCPWCADTAVITGPYTADCWSCGTVGRRDMR